MGHFQGHNVKLFTTASAWQRGRIERHGDVLKHMLERLDIQRPITSPEAFDDALLHCCQAKNALIRHDGYSPEQIVLGRSLAVPGSICSDENMASHSLAAGTDLDTCRQQCCDKFAPGTWILYWVQSSPNRLSAGKWYGPATVIMQEGSSVVWIFHRTRIVRCPPESLRPASQSEFLTLNPADEEDVQRLSAKSALAETCAALFDMSFGGSFRTSLTQITDSYSATAVCQFSSTRGVLTSCVPGSRLA